MAYTVPALEVNKPGFGVQTWSLFSPGVRKVIAQIAPYTFWWDRQNQQALEQEGKLLVVIGDSSALGVGASRPDKSYAYLLKECLCEQDGEPWRVIVLAKSGARMRDAIHTFIPSLSSMPVADKYICCIGSNDIFWSLSLASLYREAESLVAALPANSTVGLLAGSSPRSGTANKVLKNASKDRSFQYVQPWRGSEDGEAMGLAEDGFHPSDQGYEMMASLFARSFDTT